VARARSSSPPVVGSSENGCPNINDDISIQCLGSVKAHTRVEDCIGESPTQKVR
jgi:hypothetical protein